MYDAKLSYSFLRFDLFHTNRNTHKQQVKVWILIYCFAFAIDFFSLLTQEVEHIGERWVTFSGDKHY